MLRPPAARFTTVTSASKSWSNRLPQPHGHAELHCCIVESPASHTLSGDFGPGFIPPAPALPALPASPAPPALPATPPPPDELPAEPPAPAPVVPPVLLVPPEPPPGVG